jgi:hypothetical protein
MPAAKDAKTGQFVKKRKTVEELEAELFEARKDEGAIADTEPPEGKQFMTSSTEVVEDLPAPRESLVLQSRYNEHTVSIIPTRRLFHPTTGLIEPIPGLFAKFTGPQRLFDSLEEQQKWGWTDEQLDAIEQKLVSRPEYMKDYYPAPLRPVPEHLKAHVRVKQVEKQKNCMAFGYKEGNLVQCPDLATAGRDWCYDHDPNTVKITTGGGTTVG